MRLIRSIGPTLIVVAALVAGPPPAEASPAGVAALQTALDSLGFYRGQVDGIKGPKTRRGIRAFQRRRGLRVDGIAGRKTRRALGWRGRPSLGSRVMRRGNRGWDVAALQFLLQRAGHGPGRADGRFGPMTRAAVVRAQRRAGIAVDGVAGPVTIRSLRRGRGRGNAGTARGRVRFLRPVRGPIGDGFAPESAPGRRHDGLDFPVPYGTRVGAAGAGRTIFAGYNNGGYGKLVVIQHRRGFTTWYAHLSRITSWVSERVVGGTRIGYVGSTGRSTGPHLHFEVRRYNTAINPIPRLLRATASASGRGSVPSAARPPASSLECKASASSGHGTPREGNWIARESLCRK